MQSKKLITFIILVLFHLNIFSQIAISESEINSRSSQLYTEKKWDELIKFGNEMSKNGNISTLVRLRIGNAFLEKRNFQKALEQYNEILKLDSYNSLARFNSWLCLKKLNEVNFATVHIPFINKQEIKEEHLKKYAINSIGIENSYKVTNNSNRGNGNYTRFNFDGRIGWRLNFNQSIVSYHQTIKEPSLIYVSDSNNIKIEQLEYYNRMSYNLNRKIQLIAAYHFLYTPFNNFIFRNHTGMLGVRYYQNKFTLQANAFAGNLNDTAIQQYAAQIEYKPMGNNDLYTVSNLSVNVRNKKNRINFKEVVGFKVIKNGWLEGNLTIGKFTNQFENDAIYVYNSIDEKLLKGGINFYYRISPKLIGQLGYTIEKLNKINDYYIYNQHSINSGLTWKF